MEPTYPESTKPPRRLREQKAIAIIDAARTAFFEYGYARTSMDSIGAAAGVSKATLYAHYADKEALFLAVLRATLPHAQFAQIIGPGTALPPVRDHAALRELLIRIASQLLQRMLERDTISLLRVVIGELPHFPHLLQLVYTEGPMQGIRQIRVLFDHLQASGVVRAVDSEVLARTFFGILQTYVITDALLSDAPPQAPDAQRLAQHIDVFLYGIARA